MAASEQTRPGQFLRPAPTDLPFGVWDFPIDGPDQDAQVHPGENDAIETVVAGAPSSLAEGFPPRPELVVSNQRKTKRLACGMAVAS